MLVFFVIIGGLGVDALAGGRVAFELVLLLFGVGSAFAAGQRILIGRSLGLNQLSAIKGLWRTGLRLTITPGLIIAFLMIAFPNVVAQWFTSSPAIQHEAAGAIRLSGICVPFMAWSIANVQTLRAFGKTKWDMVTNLGAALVVQLPLAWLLGDVIFHSIIGCYAGVVAYWAVRALATEVLARRLVPTPQDADLLERSVNAGAAPGS